MKVHELVCSVKRSLGVAQYMDFLVIGKILTFEESQCIAMGERAKDNFAGEHKIRSDNTNWVLEALQGTR